MAYHPPIGSIYHLYTTYILPWIGLSPGWSYDANEAGLLQRGACRFFQLGIFTREVAGSWKPYGPVELGLKGNFSIYHNLSYPTYMVGIFQIYSSWWWVSFGPPGFQLEHGTFRSPRHLGVLPGPLIRFQRTLAVQILELQNCKCDTFVGPDISSESVKC